MKKDTFYFPHDFNARNDRKLIKLKLKYKMAGIGIFWSIVEMLYEEGGALPMCEVTTIAADLRERESVVRAVITDFELFDNDGERFWSESVKRRIDKRLEKSESARQSASHRWQNANGVRTQSEGNAIKERKGKENKVKEIEGEGPQAVTHPPAEILTNYFTEIGLDEFSAQAQAALFFDHYESNGWKVGGKSAMKDWKAAARNWKKRIKNFTNGTLKSTTNPKNAGALELLGKLEQIHAAGRAAND